MTFVVAAVLLAATALWGRTDAHAAGAHSQGPAAVHVTAPHDHLPCHQCEAERAQHVDSAPGATKAAAGDDDRADARTGDACIHTLHVHVSLFVERHHQLPPRTDHSRVVRAVVQETGASAGPLAFDKPPRA